MEFFETMSYKLKLIFNGFYWLLLIFNKNNVKYQQYFNNYIYDLINN